MNVGMRCDLEYYITDFVVMSMAVGAKKNLAESPAGIKPMTFRTIYNA